MVNAVYGSLGEAFQAREGKWIGAKVGLFCTRTFHENNGGYADYDWFKIDRIKDAIPACLMIAPVGICCTRLLPAQGYATEIHVALDGSGDFVEYSGRDRCH